MFREVSGAHLTPRKHSAQRFAAHVTLFLYFLGDVRRCVNYNATLNIETKVL